MGDVLDQSQNLSILTQDQLAQLPRNQLLVNCKKRNINIQPPGPKKYANRQYLAQLLVDYFSQFEDENGPQPDETLYLSAVEDQDEEEEGESNEQEVGLDAERPGPSRQAPQPNALTNNNRHSENTRPIPNRQEDGTQQIQANPNFPGLGNAGCTMPNQNQYQPFQFPGPYQQNPGFSAPASTFGNVNPGLASGSLPPMYSAHSNNFSQQQNFMNNMQNFMNMFSNMSMPSSSTSRTPFQFNEAQLPVPAHQGVSFEETIQESIYNVSKHGSSRLLLKRHPYLEQLPSMGISYPKGDLKDLKDFTIIRAVLRWKTTMKRQIPHRDSLLYAIGKIAEINCSHNHEATKKDQGSLLARLINAVDAHYEVDARIMANSQIDSLHMELKDIVSTANLERKNHPATNKAGHSVRNSSAKSQDYCYNYNSQKGCTKKEHECPYRHICSNCLRKGEIEFHSKIGCKR